MADEKIDTVDTQPAFSAQDQALVDAVDHAIASLTMQFLDPRTHDPETIHHNAHGLIETITDGLRRLAAFTATSFCGPKLGIKESDLEDVAIMEDGEIPEPIQKLVDVLREKGINVKVATLKGNLTPNIPFSGKMDA